MVILQLMMRSDVHWRNKEVYRSLAARPQGQTHLPHPRVRCLKLGVPVPLDVVDVGRAELAVALLRDLETAIGLYRHAPTPHGSNLVARAAVGHRQTGRANGPEEEAWQCRGGHYGQGSRGWMKALSIEGV